MTTKITLETDRWPVRVITRERMGSSFHNTGDKEVPAHSSETFHITSTTSLGFVELPEPATNTQPATRTSGRTEMRTEERVKANKKLEEETAARR